MYYLDTLEKLSIKLNEFPDARKDIAADKLSLLDVYKEDMAKTGNYIPSHSFWGLNLGYVGYVKDTVLRFKGIDVSYDFVLSPNPLVPLRFSLVGASYSQNNERNQHEFLIYFGQVRNYFFLSSNLFQFGFNTGVANTSKFFYRPEIGLSFGPLQLMYSFNLSFDKDLKEELAPRQLKLYFSYPLVRIGKYR
jgi:hypothetical protein